MDILTIRLPDGSVVSAPSGTTAFDVLARLPGDKDWAAARLDGRLIDLAAPVTSSGTLDPVPAESPEGIEIFRHSTSHLLAQAVQELFPGTRVTIGPATEEGFYYDFDRDGAFTPEDLDRIEQRMRDIVKRDLPIRREEMPKDEAIRRFAERGEDYKVEMLREIPEPVVSLYHQGDWVDLCRGPHLPSTGRIAAFKVLSVAGAYWRGDERNKMLQRIYGTAFPRAEQLERHLALLEEAKRRDHRKLGRDLDLFSINDEAGAGLVLFHPKGGLIRYLLEEFERQEHLRRGYHLVYGPQLLKLDLWKRSGHYENYRDYMYFTEVDEQAYGVKPMNCLAHMLIYKTHLRSYRDLPLRYFELGTVHRHERAGVLHGLLRVRGFTQDDAHILCRPDQLVQEIAGVLAFIEDVMAIFGFDYQVDLSTRPTQSIGSDTDWARATQALLDALAAKGVSYATREGEGAFYGPKIDIKLTDALGRKWQCATIQCDFALPERFDLTFVGADGERHRPAMIHRVIVGAIERFLGVLIEHYAGAFPTWLAPVQVRVLTVTSRSDAFAQEVAAALGAQGVRVETDVRNEKLGLKIREAQLQKVPYMLVVGDTEVARRAVAVRRRDGVDLGVLPLAAFVDLIRPELSPRTEGRPSPDM